MLWCKLDLSLSLSRILAMKTERFVTFCDPKFYVKVEILIVFDISDILVDLITGYLISSLIRKDERWS